MRMRQAAHDLSMSVMARHGAWWRGAFAGTREKPMTDESADWRFRDQFDATAGPPAPRADQAVPTSASTGSMPPTNFALSFVARSSAGPSLRARLSALLINPTWLYAWGKFPNIR